MTARDAYYHLLDNGEYYASPRTFYRILKEKNLNEKRDSTRDPLKQYKPKEFRASAPNQVWTWDITYFRDSRYTGKFFYAYVIIDLYSRYIVHYKVYEADNAKYAVEFLEEAINKYNCPQKLVLHSDNGSSMRANETMLLLKKYNITFSHSRPHVSNDNPYSESFFRTLKYTGKVIYPHSGFESIEQAQRWIERFINYYNNEHYHSGIRFVTPRSRFYGEDKEILAKRKEILLAAKAKAQERWISGKIQNCTPISSVTLNPDKKTA